MYRILPDCLNGHLTLPIEKHLHCALSIGLSILDLRTIFIYFEGALKDLLSLIQMRVGEVLHTRGTLSRAFTGPTLPRVKAAKK